MRVLYDIAALAPAATNPVYYTGVQRVIHEVARGLAADDRVQLWLDGSNSARAAKAFTQRDPCLASVPHVPAAQWRIAFRASRRLLHLGAPAQLVEVAERKPGSLQRRLSGWLGARANDLSQKQLSNFDIYHSPAEAFPRYVQRSRHLKRFLTVYDLSPVRMPQYSTPPFVRAFQDIVRSIQAEDYFFCISQATKDDWCEYTGANPRHCFVTPLAAADHFAPINDGNQSNAVRSRYNIPREGMYFLSLSTLEPRKNIAGLLSAFFQLLRETSRRDLYLVLVGREGWKTDSIFDAVNIEPKLRPHVVFTGYVPEHDLAALYSGARAFAYMSFFEGFGLPPLEAMQCGVPVICSRTSSLPEVVGTAGILLDPLDRDGLCAALRLLADNDALYADMSVRSRAQATQFSWKHCIEQTVGGYMQACRGGGA